MRCCAWAFVLLLAAPPAAAEQRALLLADRIEPPELLAGTWEGVVWRWGPDQMHGLVANGTGEIWCAPTRDGCRHVFEAPGEYRYHCSVHPDLTGMVIVDDRTAEEAGSLVAVFTVSLRGPAARFDASMMAHSRTAIANFSWEFGDGATGGGQVVEHVYAGPGTYIARLTVTDEFDRKSRAFERVRVRPENDPAAAFRVNKSGLTVSVDADPSIGEHSWDFGDGPLDPARTLRQGPTSLAHVYQRGGVFLVEHTFQDPDAQHHTAILDVEVDDGTPFAVHIDDLDATFDANALPHYGNASYVWIFGDTERAQGANVTHRFPGPGEWSVVLELADDVGVQRIERNVSLAAPPAAPAAAPSIVVNDPTRDTPLPFSLLFLVCLGLALTRRTGPERYK